MIRAVGDVVYIDARIDAAPRQFGDESGDILLITSAGMVGKVSFVGSSSTGTAKFALLRGKLSVVERLPNDTYTAFGRLSPGVVTVTFVGADTLVLPLTRRNAGSDDLVPLLIEAFV
jgi:hypothetical protein